MRRFIQFLLALCLMPLYGWSFGLVDNSAARDTLSIPFMVLDSTGNHVDLANGDSVYLVVFYPGGAVAFKDSMVYNDASIKNYDWEDFNGGKSYVYTERISVLDGTAPVNGVYSYILTVDDNTGADLITTCKGFFQVVTSPLECTLDSAAYALKAIDSLDKVLDSLGKIIDSLESLDNWVAHQTEVANLSGWNPASDSTHVYGLTSARLGCLDAPISSRSTFEPAAESVLVDVSSNLPYADTIANRVLEDSSHYQGHSGSGSGLYSCGLVVIDSSIAQVIPGVSVTIRNISQTALIAVGTTDSRGFAGFNLDADSFLVILFSPGYIFDSYDTLIVTGPGSDTLYGCLFDPGEPAVPGLCRLYGFVYDLNGHPRQDAHITAWLPSGVTRTGVVLISPFKIETTSNVYGYFYMDLLPNSRLIPDTTQYEVTITRTDGTILRQRVIIPDQPSWLLVW